MSRGKGGDGEKEDKIRRQEARFRSRFACVGCLVVIFIIVGYMIMASGLTAKEAEDYLQGAERRAERAADKLLHGEQRLRREDTAVVATTDEKKAPSLAAVGQNDAAQAQAKASAPHLDEHALEREVEKLDGEVRDIKDKLPRGHFMETDPKALEATKRLQEATRKLLHARYGPNEPYQVRVKLEFQPTIPDFNENGPDGSILLEMAPSRLVPHSIYSFMEIARYWKGGGFHRIAGHVLQVLVKTHAVKHLAFQEYSPEYPHVKGTVGYAGRPSGPAWYVSIADNSENHGPGSQQSHNPHEADSCFGKVIEGFDTDVQRIRKVPGKDFVNDRKKHVLIKQMQILVPGENGEYVEWAPSPTK